ncbi:DUF3298 and DUF4163 domain-containing protein [Parabacteroides bouchesdurhonensis]|uniref:DUF3298 and DUF4163 domain-containing protein n=1 Tax=Parabacteroides bouchesdurhonensis TaxID=1936995 RepID=UPI000E4768E9|nr:DUF3298 and DUF4163 domain-containing protein [Parabacteroides bouchesdurhonensis]RHJ95350.1 DUF3298 domain-containing protein [Bacteroides sp. AM07-16]
MKTQLYINGLFILFFMGLITTSCNTGTKKATENNIKFDSIHVEKTYHMLESPDNPNCNLQIEFIYPVKYTNKDILQKIQQQFVVSYFGDTYEKDTPQEAAEHYTQDYLKAYKELESDFKEELKKDKDQPVGAWFSYYEMSSNDIVYNENDILSYTVNMENYTGGAHGAHSHMNHVLNLKNGEPITEEDIFIENFQDNLSQILVDQITEQNKMENPKELENAGFFSIDEIFPNGNFLVDSTGITYTFNEYEIAAYVVGVINVHLSFDKIKHLLKQESPISPLIGN